MGGGTAEWRRRAADGENGVGDEPWVAARAARGAEVEPSRGIEEKGGAGWGIEPWAKRVSLCLGGRRRTRSPRHPDGSSRGAVALDGRDCAEHGVLGLKCARRLPRGTHVLSRGSYGMGPRRTLRIRPPPMTSLEIAGIVFYSLYRLKILRLSLYPALTLKLCLCLCSL